MATTDRIRDIHNSVFDRIRTLCSAPPAATGITAYTVYGETDIRSVQDGTLTPVRPCVFVVDADARPAETTLPLIGVSLAVEKSIFELGTDGGTAFTAIINVLGRQRGEVSLLTSLLKDNFRPLTISEYSDPDVPTAVEVALLHDAIDVDDFPRYDDRDEIRQEGTLAYWKVLTLRGLVRN